jgi:acyl dehydratase
MSDIASALADCETKLGQEVGVSNWITVDQARIDAFADLTADDQWIHVDPVRASAETPFGNTIAHGFLTLSLASRFAYDCFESYPGQVMGINYGFDKLRFLTPVGAGSRLRGRFVLASIRQRSPTQLLRNVTLTVEIDDVSSPALVADWLGLLEFQG